MSNRIRIANRRSNVGPTNLSPRISRVDAVSPWRGNNSFSDSSSSKVRSSRKPQGATWRKLHTR